MTDYPNIARLAKADPDKLTSRQFQIHVIRQDYEAKHPISPSSEKTERMAAAVPALLAHIDELYGEINDLKAKCGKQTDMLARHCATRDEVLNLLDRFNTVPADDVIAETIIDAARNLLAGGAR